MASAQEEEEGRDVFELDTYIVSGQKASLLSAQEIKRDRIEVVDSIVADDIKLPDINVTDALQRITGIQVQKDRGEGSRVTIRGLQQTVNTMNGREVFTAGLGYTGQPSRLIDFADIPAEMVGGINVFKTASANQLEGGIGGLIEMVTRRPFDYDGFEAVGSVRLIDGDLIDDVSSQYSAMITNRWELANGGEFGALLNVTFQDRSWREERKAMGNPSPRDDIIPGETVTLQTSGTEDTSFGTRERTGINAVFQWAIGDQLELYAEGTYTKFDTFQDTHQISLTGGGDFVPGSATLFEGTNDLKNITWENGSASVLSFARDTNDWTKQMAVGGVWTGEKLAVKFDLSHTDSYHNLYFVGPFFQTDVAQISVDNSTVVPSSTVSGTDLTDPGIYEYERIAYRARPYHGDQDAIAIDASYNLGSGFFHALDFGLRRAVRHVDNGTGLIFDDKVFPSAARPSATTYPNLVEDNPFGYFPDENIPLQRNFMVGVVDQARNLQSYMDMFGIMDPILEFAPDYNRYNIDETTTALYLMTRFKSKEAPFDGNIGLRAVRTKENLVGTQRNRPDGEPEFLTPLNLKSKYDNLLPSMNLRYSFDENLIFRVSGSKTLTRPNFNQISPTLTLIPHPDPSLNQGSGGNPDLGPIKSTNIDIALEKYFSEGSNIYVTFFHKDVDGFVVSESSTESIDGVNFLINRPRNANTAKIKGFEIGYTQWFSELPGALSGLGLQANYTYIDSESPDAALGDNSQLPNLSENSYNLIAMYEKDKISGRIAYNWRDDYRSGSVNVVNQGSFPVLTGAYGWLDASVSYDLNEKVSFSLEGSNLGKTKRISFYGVRTRPGTIYTNDRQVSLYTTFRF